MGPEETAPSLADELPAELTALLARHLPGFGSPSLADALDRASCRALDNDVSRASSLALAALSVVEHLPEVPLARRVAAWVRMSEALLSASDSSTASETLELAEEIAGARPDSATQALLLRAQGELRFHCGECGRALQLASDLVGLRQASGTDLEVAEALRLQGIYLEAGGRTGGAIEALQHSVDITRDMSVESAQRCFLGAMTGLAVSLFAGGEPGRAVVMVANIRPRLEVFGDLVPLARLAQLEARLAIHYDQLSLAEEKAWDACLGWAKAGRISDASVLGLEIARRYAAKGNENRIKALSLAVTGAFRQGEADGNQIAVWRMLEELVEQGTGDDLGLALKSVQSSYLEARRTKKVSLMRTRPPEAGRRLKANGN